ncbi:EF-hand calcium-binding domain-containing protein 13-like [Tupaia chinensis]|uniref:EF-hand calcium-binding domain-containing protein 13-like n=1 Tax=Tupaia chinensis TaxID=246437 RepID=UPI000FFC44F5|nr:EF-hand calcium-binding domain-containing protein 13-like [Tupaia chinensis]
MEAKKFSCIEVESEFPSEAEKRLRENGKVTIQEFMTKFSDTLITPKAAEEKNKLYDSNIHKSDVTAISDLHQNLNAIGIFLSDDKIQKALDNTNPNDEVVHFKDFIRELTNTDEFIECQKIENAWNIVNSVSDGKVEVKDLLSTLKSMEKPLNGEQLKEVLNSATDERKMILNEIDVFTNSSKPSTPLNNLFKEITTLDNIRNDKMPTSELNSKLLSAGIPLSDKTFQEILRQASVDENSEVSLKQILENLNRSKPAPVFEDIQTAFNTINLKDCDRIPVNDLKNAFDDLNVSLKPEEHQMLEKILDVDENGDVSLRTALLALKNNKRFQDFKEVNEVAKALDKVSNEKIDIDDVKSILKGLGIYLPEEELQEVLGSIYVDNEGKVDLKDFLSRLRQTPYFTKGSEIEGPLKALASIRKNVVNPDDIGSILKNMGVPLPQDVIQRTLKNVALREDGTVNLEEFMSNLVNSRFSSVPEGHRVDDSSLTTFLGDMRLEMSADNKAEKKNEIKERASVGENIDVSNVDAVLNIMDIKLTEEERQDLLEHLSATADEDMDMNTLVGVVKMLKEKIEICNLDNFLDDMGIELTYKEHKDLVNNLPTSADGKINQLKLMDTMKTVKGGKVDTQKLSNTLEKMGVELTNKEFQHLQEHLPVDANGKVDLNTLLDEVKVLKKNAEQIDSNNLDTILEKMGMSFSDKEYGERSHNRLADEEVKLNKLLTAAIPGTGETEDIGNLGNILRNMGIKVTKEELGELMRNLPVDANGKTDLKSLTDVVRAVTGREVDLNDLENVTKNMKIELTSKENLEPHNLLDGITVP